MCGSEETIARWKRDADEIGADLNTVAVQWTHAKALATAIERSERAKAHPEAFYVNVFVLAAVRDQVVLGLRRQVDRDARAHSFRNLLRDLIDNPGVYSLDACVATFLERADRSQFLEPRRSNYEAQARSLYAVVADASGVALDIATMQADLDRLNADCAGMKTLADKHVAHRDRDRFEHAVEFQEFDTTIRDVKRLMRKYTRLLDGGGDGEGEEDLEEMLFFYRFAWLE